MSVSTERRRAAEGGAARSGLLLHVPDDSRRAPVFTPDLRTMPMGGGDPAPAHEQLRSGLEAGEEDHAMELSPRLKRVLMVVPKRHLGTPWSDARRARACTVISFEEAMSLIGAIPAGPLSRSAGVAEQPESI